jgi:hypothetical protein
VVCFYFSYEICFKLQLFKLLDPSALQPFHESQHGRSLEVAHIRSSTRRCADNSLWACLVGLMSPLKLAII